MCVCLSVPRLPPPPPPPLPGFVVLILFLLSPSLTHFLPSSVTRYFSLSQPLPCSIPSFLCALTHGTPTFIPLLSSFLIFFPPLSLPSPLIHSLVSLSPLTLFHTDFPPSLPVYLLTHPLIHLLSQSSPTYSFFSLARKKAATLFLQTFYFSQHVIEVDENPKTSIKHLVCYGVGVWVSVWKFPSIKLFHSETLKHVQDISISSPVTNMQRG